MLGNIHTYLVFLSEELLHEVSTSAVIQANIVQAHMMVVLLLDYNNSTICVSVICVDGRQDKRKFCLTACYRLRLCLRLIDVILLVELGDIPSFLSDW